MDATTMAATASLVAELIRDFPQFTFKQGGQFRWEPDSLTVHYAMVKTERDKATLLHELGHAMCGHTDFEHDIELIKMEREAWTKAEAIATDYGVAIKESLVEESLDTYRDWLDARSRCPRCNQTGIQEGEGTYQCLICNFGWRVNDARQCGLKRYRLSIE